MKVLSLLQPWASLVVLGHKKIETRSWNTKYRGPLLIHASAGKKNLYRGITLDFQQEFYSLQLPHYKDLPFGAIIGKVDLRDTTETTLMRTHYRNALAHYPKLSEQEYSFGNYASGRYGWLLDNPLQFGEPIPAKGSLGLWEFPDIEEVIVIDVNDPDLNTPYDTIG